MPQSDPDRILYFTNDNELAQAFQKDALAVGYQVDVAACETVSTFSLPAQNYLVFLIDCSTLPSDQGVSVIQHLIGLDNAVPILALIKLGCEEAALEAIALGADDYIVKDDVGSYLKLLSVVIDQARQRRKLNVETTQYLAELEQRNRDLTLLARVGHELTATLDLQQVIEQLLQAVAETLGAEGSSVWLWEDERRETLICQAVFSRHAGRKLVNLRVASGQGVVGWVAQQHKRAIVPSVKDDPRFSSDIDSRVGFQTRSLIAVPLLLGEQIAGVLEVVNKVEGSFTEADCVLIETLAAPAAIAIENARLVEALRTNSSQLERQNEDLDAFAHTVAHDLNNPLSLIAGTAQVLESDFLELTAEDIQHHLKAIYRNSQKAASLVDELLLLAELRESDIVMQPLHMPSILHEVQRHLRHLVEAQKAELIVADSWPMALGYAPWVEQVWVNYISNALKYGGRPPRIELGATEIAGQISFWVKDNGDGLSEAEQAQLFRPFKRFNRVRATGYGLGLSIVRRIMEKLGGQVDVESSGNPGEGCLFSFTLPAMINER